MYIRILENDDWIVEYDIENNIYRVGYFQDNHFVDEVWFNTNEWMPLPEPYVPDICVGNIKEQRDMGFDRPIVCDTDKVIEQLKENYSCDVGNLKMISLDRAIEIVKKGGVE